MNNNIKKRVVVEPELHKKLKALAVELAMPLQDLIALALELFVKKIIAQQQEELNE